MTRLTAAAVGVAFAAALVGIWSGDDRWLATSIVCVATAMVVSIVRSYNAL